MSSDMDRTGGGPKSGGSGESRGSNRKQLKSKKLDRTLKELEGAFASWESLNDTKARATSIEEDRRKAKEAEKREQTELEFRKKTRKLLNQLREQLADFSDD